MFQKLHHPPQFKYTEDLRLKKTYQNIQFCGTMLEHRTMIERGGERLSILEKNSE